jgi:FAD:protein FMN transferase
VRRALLLLVLVLPLGGCRSSPPPGRDPGLRRLGGGWFETARPVYGRIPARLKFRLPDRRAATAEAVAAAAWDEIERLGRVFNAFDPTSETGRLNANAVAGPTHVSPDLAAVVRIAGQVHAASDGAFDPTVWPLKRLWRDAAARGRPPTEEEVRAARAQTGLARVRLEDGRSPRLWRAAPGIQLDFGGIAKGYAVDRVEAVMRERGVLAALVQIGGEILAFGRSDIGPWRLGVQHPTERGRLYGVIVHEGTVRLSTSGNYQQPLHIAGRTYYHIFDPATGWPVATRTQGVTLAAFDGGPDNATLDALAKVPSVLGAERGVAVVRRLGVEALVIEGEGALTETVTPGLRSRWRKDESAAP